MRCFYVILADQSVFHSGLYLNVPKKLLNLLNWHTTINGIGGHSTTELVRVDARQLQLFAKRTQTIFHRTDGDSCMVAAKADE